MEAEECSTTVGLREAISQMLLEVDAAGLDGKAQVGVRCDDWNRCIVDADIDEIVGFGVAQEAALLHVDLIFASVLHCVRISARA
jgi:hypothetical protein